ncbi:hypothetical protein BOTBODRAFT_329608 [Botryobasidium botryosum FD-172 SS1]|uniref:Uncharacterized protein n=1 Tax=Botryobasidium botryosum (strain FD-172 SS1) TaxID=930990 RepID=A0A067MGZ7_BOTB1|nr:hypothetical protein BOTBODRAFT_329608 [Botryobasidium botryosum FD-172 SS1]
MAFLQSHPGQFQLFKLDEFAHHLIQSRQKTPPDELKMDLKHNPPRSTPPHSHHLVPRVPHQRMPHLLLSHPFGLSLFMRHCPLQPHCIVLHSTTIFPTHILPF